MTSLFSNPSEQKKIFSNELDNHVQPTITDEFIKSEDLEEELQEFQISDSTLLLKPASRQISFWKSSYWKFAFIQHIKQIKHNKVKFFLGFLSCLLVVFFSSLLLSVTSKTPIVFLMLAETESGEIDFKGLPLGLNENYTGRLNYSLTAISMNALSAAYHLHTPRLGGNIFVYPARACPSEVDMFDPSWKYSTGNPNDWKNQSSCIFSPDACFLTKCENQNYGATLYLINSKQERALMLGREWNANYEDIPPGTAYISSNLASEMSVGEGDHIIFRLNGTIFFDILWKNIVQDNMIHSNYSKIFVDTIYIPVTISKVVNPSGKFPSDISTLVIMDFDSFLSYVQPNLNPAIGSDILKLWSNTNLNEYAGEILWNHPTRTDIYLSTDYDAISEQIVTFGSEITYQIGFSDIITVMPVLEALGQTVYISLFLGLILDVVVSILVILCIIMVYSLLTINMESRGYDLGVMRCIGTSKLKIMYLLALEAFTFSIPSLFLGLALAEIAVSISMFVFGKYLYLDLNPWLSWESLLISSLIVLLIPLFSSILPIQEILDREIYSSLDLRRSKTKAVAISINRSEKNALQDYFWVLFGLGSCFGGFGFVNYFLFPYSLVSMQLQLMAYILVFLLMAMILGSVLLSLNAFSLLEKLFLFLFFFWEKESIVQLLQKNLISHRPRNRKTTIMFALTVGFIIFLAVSYSLQAESFLYLQKRTNGAYLKVYSRGGSLPVAPLEQIGLSNPNIVRFSWGSWSLGNLVGMDFELTNLGHVYVAPVEVFSVSPNYFQVSFEDYVKIDSSSVYQDFNTLLEYLYSVDGSRSIIMGSYWASQIGVMGASNPRTLLERLNPSVDYSATSFGLATPKVNETVLLQPLAYLDNAAGYYFSKYPRNPVIYSNLQAGLISFTSYIRLSFGKISSVDEIPLQNFYFKLKDGITDGEISEIKNQVQVVLSPLDRELFWGIWDYNESVNRIQLGNMAFSYIFIFTITSTMFICFFSLMASMFTNIFEQSKEIALMKTLGLSNGVIYKLYIYEGFLVVFVSSILGVGIGTFIGYTMVMQRMLFTQMAIPFVFPWELLLVIFGLSMVFACIASYYPLSKLMKRNLVDLLRG